VPYSETYAQKAVTLQAYSEAHATYKNTFAGVAEKLQRHLENLKFDDQQTQISFQLRTNDAGLKEACADFVKQNNLSRVSLRSDDIQSVVFGDGTVPVAEIVADPTKLVEMVNNSQTADVHTQILKQLINDPTFVEKLHLRLQRIYFDIGNIQVQTKLGDKFLQNTSFGERCGIVIAIVLVAGTNPIVMDQPEDNLDGKYISKVLVPLIREQKTRRQIVLVTRDANIVVGGDAELILILDKDGSGTKLSPATIENKELRPQYIWILDGGETAFRKREEKYAIPQGAAGSKP
jgi:DNA repair protein SbcC/Rad50